MYLSSLSLITVDRLKYSELCLSFFKMMESLSRFAFQFVFDFSEDKQKMLVDSIIWGYMDTERRIYECSLDTMITIVNSVRASNDAFKQPFYHSFLVYIMTHTLYRQPVFSPVGTVSRTRCTSPRWRKSPRC